MYEPTKPDPWGWSVTVLTLCVVQSWLLASAAPLLGACSSVSIVVATCGGIGLGDIAPRLLVAMWSSAIAWTIAEILLDIRFRAIGWGVVLSVLVAIAIAFVCLWAWWIVTTRLRQHLRQFYRPWQTSACLCMTSLSGIAVGSIVANWKYWGR